MGFFKGNCNSSIGNHKQENYDGTNAIWNENYDLNFLNHISFFCLCFSFYHDPLTPDF